MDDISSNSIRAIADGVSSYLNLPVQSVMQGSPLSISNLKKGGFVSWNLFVDWMEWIEQTHSALDWKEIGKRAVRSPLLPLLKTITRMTLSVKLGYWVSCKWFGPSQFRVIAADYQEVGANQITMTMKLAKDLRPCRSLFILFEGCLEVMPKDAFGLQETLVHATYSDHQAVYQMTLPQQQTLWMKIRFFAQIFFKARFLLRELVYQQEMLQEQSTKIFNERSEFKNLIDHFPDGIFIHHEGIIQYGNPRIASYLGFSDSQQLVGRHILELIHPKDQEAVKKRIAKFKKNPKYINPPIEVSMIRVDTKEIFYAEVTSLLTVFEGMQTVAVIFRDLSDRKKWQAQEILQDRLMALGQLAAGVGHEINNPLFYVMMKVEKLLSQSEQKGLIPEMFQLEDVQQGLQKIQTIVKELKSFSRGHFDETPTNVSIESILFSAIGMARNQIRHRARLKIEIQKNLPLVEGNEARLGQVFLNLIINAAQAIEPGNADANEIEIKAYYDAFEQVIVEVRDTGKGIPEEIRRNLFQPFYTTKPVGEGTGLGLSICHSILSKYNGYISFESQVGKGSLFLVSLPASEAALAQGDQVPEILAKKPTVSGRVLLIDDDEELLSVLEGVIASEHDTVAFSDARLALKFIEEQNSEFDCIVCDLMMPNMDGAEFYSELRKLRPQLCERMMFMTGGSFTEKTDEFLSQPNVRFKEKPIHSTELLNIVGDLVLAVNQKPTFKMGDTPISPLR